MFCHGNGIDVQGTTEGTSPCICPTKVRRFGWLEIKWSRRVRESLSLCVLCGFTGRLLRLMIETCGFALMQRGISPRRRPLPQRARKTVAMKDNEAIARYMLGTHNFTFMSRNACGPIR